MSGCWFRVYLPHSLTHVRKIVQMWLGKSARISGMKFSSQEMFFNIPLFGDAQAHHDKLTYAFPSPSLSFCYVHTSHSFCPSSLGRFPSLLIQTTSSDVFRLTWWRINCISATGNNTRKTCILYFTCEYSSSVDAHTHTRLPLSLFGGRDRDQHRPKTQFFNRKPLFVGYRCCRRSAAADVDCSLFMYLCRAFILAVLLLSPRYLCSISNGFGCTTFLRNHRREQRMMYGWLTQFTKSINILLNYDCCAKD